MLTVILFLAGLVLVWKGADFLIDGSAGLAHRLGIRTFIIGLTVVSFGTSAPELLVNIFAAARGASGLALGNVMGSNVANLLMILGIAAILGRVHAQRTTMVWELPATILITVLVATMIYLPQSGTALGRLDAVVLLVLFAGFLYYVYRIARNGDAAPRLTAMSTKRGVLLVLIGTAGLGLGAHWLVTSGLEIAAALGLTEGFVGFFFIAVGTSLPEVAATISAARKIQFELAVGNIVGSNIFNLLFVLGVTGLLLPLRADADTPLQIASAAVAPLVVFLLFLTRRKRALHWPYGVLLVTLYVTWVGWLFQHLRS